MLQNFWNRFFSRRPATRIRRQPKTRLWCEILEDRVTPTTTASISFGLLTITGDAGNNDITVTELATPGRYLVTAPDLLGAPLTFDGVSNISIDTSSGTDSLTFNGSAAAGTTLLGSLSITSTGTLTVNFNDAFNVTGLVALNHITAADTLNVAVTGASASLGALLVFDGNADSSITIQNSAVINGFVSLNMAGGNNTATIQSGAAVVSFLSLAGNGGNDVLVLTNARVNGNLGLLLGAGTNQLIITTSTIGGRTLLYTSGQNETIAIQGGSTLGGFVSVNKTSDTGALNVSLSATSTIRGFLSVASGAGADSLTINGNVGNNVGVNFGAGAGTLIINDCDIAGRLLHFGTGALTFTMTATASVAGSLTLNSTNAATATVNATIATSSVGGATVINAGASNGDVVVITDSSLGGSLTVNLGGGNAETLTVVNSSIVGSLFFLGTGNLDLTLDNVSAGGSVFVNAVVSLSAIVTVDIDDTSIAGALSIFGGTSVDQVDIDNTRVFGPTNIALNADADVINTNGVTFIGIVSINLGAGADVVTFQTTATADTRFEAAFTLSAGTENDTINLGTSGGGTVFFAGLVNFQGGNGVFGGLNTIVRTDAVFLASRSRITIVNFNITPLQVFATSLNTLFAFDAGTPGTIANPGGAGGNLPVAITGLVGGVGEAVVGIDFRPATGALYALTRDSLSVGRIYVLSTAAATFGQATLVATLAASLSGTSFGFDFNASNDRIRVTSNTGQNLAVNPINGAVTINSALNPSGLDVTGNAYINNFAGATSALLFDIAAGNDTLQILNVGTGVLTNVGSLTVDTDTNIGFDIGFGNAAFASLTVGGTSSFYVIDLTTGRATAVGDIGGGAVTIVTGMAVQLT